MCTHPDCELCCHPGGELLWQDDRCRVVLVTGAEAAAFPGFSRVIWHEHVAEISDLPPGDAQHLFTVVQVVERVLRDILLPDKINLASLGNLTPHLHWHVIPRWRDDSHFPLPIWATAQRAIAPRAPGEEHMIALRTALAALLPFAAARSALSSP